VKEATTSTTTAQNRDQHIAAGPAHHEGEIGVTAHVDAAGHRDEGRAGHPVRRRRHAVEHGRNLPPRHVVGIDLHGPGKPTDAGIDHHREGDEENADGIGLHPHLLQNRHQNDENDEPAGIEAINPWQVVDEIAGSFEETHLNPP
jgi:hypothetical protein